MLITTRLSLRKNRHSYLAFISLRCRSPKRLKPGWIYYNAWSQHTQTQHDLEEIFNKHTPGRHKENSQKILLLLLKRRKTITDWKNQNYIKARDCQESSLDPFTTQLRGTYPRAHLASFSPGKVRRFPAPVFSSLHRLPLVSRRSRSMVGRFTLPLP